MLVYYAQSEGLQYVAVINEIGEECVLLLVNRQHSGTCKPVIVIF